MNYGKSTQILFFEMILNNNKASKNHITEIGNLLNISKSAIYKRISGETLLDFEEIITLSKHYHININELITNETDIETDFRLSSLVRQPQSIGEYLTYLIINLKEIKKSTNVLIRFGTLELSFFHFYEFYSLTAFRLYVYSKYIWELPEFANKKFSIKDVLTPEVEDLIESMNTEYCQQPTVEIWSNFIMDIYLNQIMYHISLGLFEDPDEALLLISQLKGLNNKLLESTATDVKTFTRRDGVIIQSPFQLYQIEFLNFNNTAIVTSDGINVMFYTFDSPNLLVSSNKRLINYTINWFEKIRKKAAPLDKISERNRFRFFNKMESKINEYEKELKFMLQK